MRPEAGTPPPPRNCALRMWRYTRLRLLRLVFGPLGALSYWIQTMPHNDSNYSKPMTYMVKEAPEPYPKRTQNIKNYAKCDPETTKRRCQRGSRNAINKKAPPVTCIWSIWAQRGPFWDPLFRTSGPFGPSGGVDFVRNGF